MAKFHTNLTASNEETVTWPSRRRDHSLRASVWAKGTFSGGSVVIQADGGSGFVNLTDSLGNPLSFAVEGVKNFELQSDNDQPVKLKFLASAVGAVDIDMHYR